MNRREFLKLGSMGLMTLAFAGCGFSSLTGNSSGQGVGSASSAVAASSDAAKTGSKTLVVYYSATGRTERVAKVIAKERQADIMKLVPSPDYSETDLDYNDEGSRVSREHNDASLREKIQLGLGQLEEIHPVLDLDLIDVELLKQCFLNQHGYLMSPGRVPGDGDYRLLLVIAWWKPASTDAHGPEKCVE